MLVYIHRTYGHATRELRGIGIRPTVFDIGMEEEERKKKRPRRRGAACSM